MAAPTINAEYVGQDTGRESAPQTSVDLRSVTVGRGTFENPCFWILVGIIGTIGVQYMMKRSR
jgi:hypothetical protein